MVLRQIQELIGGIYDVSIAHDVYDFLVTDRQRLPSAARADASDEQLIVATDAHDSVRVSLYLDPALLERLQRMDPIRALHAGNLADYWTALEGVSHFVYFAWNAAHDKSVSLLELELQAEIDKYIASYWVLRQQFPERFPAELLRLLFERTRIEPTLAQGREEIYRRASLYAQKFCGRIERALRTRRMDIEQLVMAELRRFYRLTDARKRAHIERND
ncbi:MAG TPA: hypothetical protein VMG11_05630 [Steroidobacteraceae bacterium]|nr:hypothetical protein [Steroidobacteraceae bacterium]